MATDETLSERLSRELGVSRMVAELLCQRGIRDARSGVEFLKPTLLSLYSPFCFKDMRQGVQRLLTARRAKEKILIYGDYDVDGVSATALLYKALIDLGFQVATYIPNRQNEGYGLHAAVIEKAVASGVRILLTVDCGVTAVQEVELAHQAGIDVIITDHHESGSQLPAALALIDPKLEPDLPFRDWAGVGVAFKLVQALLETLRAEGDASALTYSEIGLLDLVALGTIADVVPLAGENRILVHAGIAQMEQTEHLGLEALLLECGLSGKPLKAGQIAFILAPRINAAGRLDSARLGLELMLTGDQDRAMELAKQLTQENRQRQQIEKEILAEAQAQLAKDDAIPRVIVLSASHWHVGVIGIVASRLAELYYRPVFLMTVEDGAAKGSARGISGYHVLENLDRQKELLTKYGGHRQAAGFALPAENIDLLRNGLNYAARELDEAVFSEKVSVDLAVYPNELDGSFYRELEMLAPFGAGNRSPLLAARSLPVYNIRKVGKAGEHLKLELGKKGEWEAIAFRQGPKFADCQQMHALDILFTLEVNHYQDRERLQLVLRDLESCARWADAGQALDEPTETAQEAAQLYTQEYVPREELVKVYHELKELSARSSPFILHLPQEQQRKRIAVKIFEELGLVQFSGGTEYVRLYLVPQDKKLVLESSWRYRSAKKYYEEAQTKDLDWAKEG
jgi:single-stranded-DNA-specific exonuclease